MIKFGKAVVKLRIPILILSIFLLIPSAIGYFNTRVNYDILTYLPEEIETMKGQDLLLDEFGTGAFSFCVVEGMDAKDISAMREQMEEVPHVKSVIWYDSLADISIPMEMLPDEIYDSLIMMRRTAPCSQCYTIHRCPRTRRWMRLRNCAVW